MYKLSSTVCSCLDGLMPIAWAPCMHLMCIPMAIPVKDRLSKMTILSIMCIVYVTYTSIVHVADG